MIEQRLKDFPLRSSAGISYRESGVGPALVKFFEAAQELNAKFAAGRHSLPPANRVAA